MKVRHVVLGTGAVVALSAAMPTFAQTVEIRISGASALQISIQKSVAEICDPALPNSNRNIYRGTPTSAGTTYTCTSRAAIFGGVARPVIIRKRDAGGSGQGVLPLNTPGTQVQFVQTAGCTTTGGPVEDLDPTGAVLNFVTNSGCPLVNQAVMYGISDVEPRLFAAQGPVGNVSGVPILGQLFGVAMSQNLWNAVGALPGFGGQANIRAVDYRAIVAGNYRDWTQVYPTIANGGAGGTAIKVCRRVATSGTQQTSNVFFLNNPCGPGSLSPTTNLTDDWGGNNADGSLRTFAGGNYAVVMNSAAGDVDACLTAANNQGEFAVGILGLERVPDANPSDDPDGISDEWNYARLDGVAPTVANAIAGDYNNVFDATWNRNPAIGYTAQQEQLANFFISTMGNPATISGAGLLGVAALPDNGFDPTSQSPVLFGSRGGNSCRPILNVFP